MISRSRYLLQREVRKTTRPMEKKVRPKIRRPAATRGPCSDIAEANGARPVSSYVSGDATLLAFKYEERRRRRNSRRKIARGISGAGASGLTSSVATSEYEKGSL